MKGNFLLKLIFCFALGPRLRVPVDLGKIKSLLSLWLNQLSMDLTTNQLEFSAWELRRLDTACSNENPLSSPKVAFWSCECTREADIASGPHGDTVRVHDVTWKRNCQADVKTRHAKEYRQSDVAKRTHPKLWQGTCLRDISRSTLQTEMWYQAWYCWGKNFNVSSHAHRTRVPKAVGKADLVFLAKGHIQVNNTIVGNFQTKTNTSRLSWEDTIKNPELTSPSPDLEVQTSQGALTTLYRRISLLLHYFHNFWTYHPKLAVDCSFYL